MTKFALIGTSLVCLLHSASSYSEDSLLEKRVQKELKTSDKAFVITPHKVNYMLPVTFQTNTNLLPFKEKFPDQDHEIDNLEAKFQFSFKIPVWYNMFGDNGHLFFAYTNQSYWQVYNQDLSSPFRETNHEPEVFMLFNNDWEIAGFKNSFLSVGVVHQSNGQTNTLSRSWNRIYGTMVFDQGPVAFELKAWWIVPEDEKESANAAIGDDNPDIEDYIGNIEFTGIYGLNEHRFAMILRNNLSITNKGSVELTWSYPIVGNLRVYTQYFNGYGESLIDYNHHNQRIGLGVALNDIF